jgi:hypothetical protein
MDAIFTKVRDQNRNRPSSTSGQLLCTGSSARVSGVAEQGAGAGAVASGMDGGADGPVTRRGRDAGAQCDSDGGGRSERRHGQNSGEQGVSAEERRDNGFGRARQGRSKGSAVQFIEGEGRPADYHSH